MIDLIMVGMRYCEGGRPKVGQTLYLHAEPTNKENKEAVAVHSEEYPWSVVDGLNATKVGYVRNDDLWGLHKQVRKWPIVVKVTRVSTNWMKLVPQNQAIATDEIGAMLRDIHDKHCHTEDCRYKTHLDGTFATGGVWPMPTNNTCKEVPIPTKQTEQKTMFNTNNFKDSFFKDVKNVAMDMQTGKLGVITKEGIVVANDDGVAVNPITEFGFKIPAIAMRVPVENLQKGDILISGDDTRFFLEGSKTGGYLTIDTKGLLQETGNVTNMFFGKNTVLAVKNMFGDSSTGMNPMMMAMAFGDGEFDFKKMLMLQMFSGGGNALGGEMNPMMMFALFGDKLK